MHLLQRLLLSLPQNMLAPAVFLLVGWYGGAKVGAPTWALDTVDGTIANISEIAGNLMGGDEAAPAEDAPEE
ncbi:MAG: hypothetical protein ACX939_05850 [Hyphococcus sp.]